MNDSRIIKIISVFSVILLIVIFGISYLSGHSSSLPVQSYSCSARGCGNACNGSTRCILEYQDGKKEYYCCPHCAFPNRMWKLGHGEHIRKVMVVDFETGKTINAVGAYYLVDSKLHICCIYAVSRA